MPDDGEETALPQELPIQQKTEPLGEDQEVLHQGQEGPLFQAEVRPPAPEAGLLKALQAQAQALLLQEKIKVPSPPLQQLQQQSHK